MTANNPQAGGGSPPTGGPAGVSTGAVARRLGVSPTTIRSWERRYGIGPSHRDPGQHRRWSPDDIALLDEMCRLTSRGIPPAEAAKAARSASRPDTGDPAGDRTRTPDHGHPDDDTGSATGRRGPATAPARSPGGSRAIPLGTVSPACRGLARAAVRLDGPEIARILRLALADLGAVRAWTEVMMPSLFAAGRKWAADAEQYVEVEHLLSWHVSAALRTAAVTPTRFVQAPPALLAAMPGEEHTLPLEAVAAAMAERGLPYRMLGAAVPPRALLDAVARLGPPAVMLWSQSHHTADLPLAQQVADAQWGPAGSRGGPRVIPAGPGWRRHESGGRFAGPRTLEAALGLIEQAISDSSSPADVQVPGRQVSGSASGGHSGHGSRPS
ncbi:MerR family transcriptional regulator [Streptomyces sp. TLI_171]|uniref:MerR family transcriptional regulator n=1 Tax=Streptomyces sp. TLI_171 TaxID=1938859 RepID=UPI000C19DFB5|nr:MerR family transcriptional regulator [Streptomyces sp. TLI_171]RKE23501.1 B12 binding protein [Streptomyces sp. TLI_171]